MFFCYFCDFFMLPPIAGLLISQVNDGLGYSDPSTTTVKLELCHAVTASRR